MSDEVGGLTRSNTAAKLTERYDQGAGIYRELWAPILRDAALPLVERLGAAGGDPVQRVLDVGTGVGSLLPDLSGQFPGASIVGVDRSRGMLGLASERYGRAVMDARQLATRSAAMDRVLLVFMLFHLEDPQRAVREAGRVLRAGGWIGTLTWGDDLSSAAMRIWSECLDAHGAIPGDPAAEARHRVVDAPAKMAALLHGAGFQACQSWEAELVATIDTDHLLRLKTNLGSSRDRFVSLLPERAEACLEDARQRLSALGSDDFVARGRIVYAIAQA